MNHNYAKAYTEVLEIISHFSEEEYSKIPTERIKFFESNMDKEYDYKINPGIDLSEQYISNEANAILIILFRDYFATEKQKQILQNILKQNQERLEKEKREKYNPDNIFKEEMKKDIEKDNTNNNVQLVEYKSSFFSKFRKFIFRLLHKNFYTF